MTDQSLWHGSIDRIHGHMIPIVGCPAKRQFREIAGSDHQSILLICNVHKNLRTLTRLRILIRHIMHRIVLSDIREMYIDCILDIHFHKLRAKTTDQIDRIIICAIRCTESRHRYRSNPLAILSKQIKRTNRDKQRKRGIQSTRDSNHGSCTGMFQTFLKSHRLNHQNLITTLIPLILISRYKRRRINIAGQFRLLRLQFKGSLYIAILRRKRRHPASLRDQFLHIDLRVDHAISETLRLCQKTSVLRNQIVSGEDQILG